MQVSQLSHQNVIAAAAAFRVREACVKRHCWTCVYTSVHECNEFYRCKHESAHDLFISHLKKVMSHVRIRYFVPATCRALSSVSVQNIEYTWVQFSSVTVISNKDSLLQSIYLYRRIMRSGIESIDALELKKLASQPYTGAHTHHNMITTHDNKYTQKHTSECTSKHTGVKPRTLN